ncbi:LemA family protein [Mariniblastus sp.]|nr:LemA family protein [Mariniblastus sp.]
MFPLLITIGVLVVLFLIIAGWVMGVYNRLVTLRNRYENAFSQIDVQLKRRHDLIPNLVKVAKGYMAHEKDTLEAVISARNQAISASSNASKNPGDASAMNELAGAEQNLNGALGRLLMIAESYPDLKANENMLALQEELTSTENKVSFARQAYNDAVTAFNTARELFPASMIAGMFGFKDAQLFEVEDKGERNVPEVNFE